jgi:hypothetical protein
LLLCISGGREKEAEQKRERIGAATADQSRLLREEVFSGGGKMEVVFAVSLLLRREHTSGSEKQREVGARLRFLGSGSAPQRDGFALPGGW